MLHQLIDAILTGDGFDDVELLLAAACAEQVILGGPHGLYDAEPVTIAGYLGIVAAYRRLLDHLDAAEKANCVE